MSEQQPKPAPKKTKKTKQIPTPKFESVTVVCGTTEGGVVCDGDALVRVNATDRHDLARQLVMLAGHVSSTIGDPIESATILVVTKRKR